jgi:DNA (cytosine-5)-methyltransferase 1
MINDFDFNKIDFSESWIDKKFKFPKATIRLATMFSGIGAVEFALKRLNLSSKIIFASDNDKFVKESYFANYSINENNWYEDVLNIDGNKYKHKIDLLVGGEPVSIIFYGWKKNGL